MSVPDVKAIAVNSENGVEANVQPQENGTDSRVFRELLKLGDDSKSNQGVLKIIVQKKNLRFPDYYRDERGSKYLF